MGNGFSIGSQQQNIDDIASQWLFSVGDTIKMKLSRKTRLSPGPVLTFSGVREFHSLECASTGDKLTVMSSLRQEFKQTEIGSAVSGVRRRP